MRARLVYLPDELGAWLDGEAEVRGVALDVVIGGVLAAGRASLAAADESIDRARVSGLRERVEGRREAGL